MSVGNVAWLANTIGISDVSSINSSFDERLKLQKATYLLKHFNVSEFAHYNFGLYIRGPYSSALADDYYNLEGVEPEPVNLSSKYTEMLCWFINHPNNWLEVAASILSIEKTNKNIREKNLFSLLRLSKPWVTKRLFAEILGDLKEKGIR